jgi:hypothetical protein
MHKKLKLIIGNFTLLILLFVSSIQPATARLIFADDVFENDSETYQIGSDDDAATSLLTLDFGGINSETITWDTTSFLISNDLGVEGDLSQEGTTFTLDSDNIGSGTNVDIIADQGTDNPGILRYNSLNNRWEISNDGGTFEAISTGGGSTLNLDDAYNNFAASSSTIFVDAGEGQVGGLTFDGSLTSDETVSITNSGNGGTLFLSNTGSGDSFTVHDEASDTTPFVIDYAGFVGIGTGTPGANVHLYDISSTTVSEWQMFDDGTNQVSIYTGTYDPTVTAVDADTGSIFLNTDTGFIYIKKDDGSTTNWEKSGLTDDLWGALIGSHGTPSESNPFVTDTDPRLIFDSGNDFGEISLGSRLDYQDDSLPLDRTHIYYHRVFLAENTILDSMAIFTTSAKTGNVNLGLYDHNDITHAPGDKIAETGSQAGTSPVDDFWLYDLTSSYTVTTSDYYWLALAISQSPKTRTYNGAADSFIPYRVETKAVATSTTLPATATPDAKGSNHDIPYIAAFDILY